MLKVSIIGYIGADAVVKSANGREFTTCRVAHTNRWKDNDGVPHEETDWVDVTLQGRPAVLPYLTRGQLVFVEGNARQRIYSSAKERCMKAGLLVNASSIELLGGKSDDVPAVLYNPADGSEVSITKYFHARGFDNPDEPSQPYELRSRSGELYTVDANGWVTKNSEN